MNRMRSAAIGSKQATASVGGHTWDVYRGSNGSNAVFSFVRTGNTFDVLEVGAVLRKPSDAFGVR